jgi:hypothetical protein
MRALVVDVSHALTDGVHSRVKVGDHGIFAPTTFPQLVQHFHVFLCYGVAGVVLDLLVETEVAGRAVEL